MRWIQKLKLLFFVNRQWIYFNETIKKQGTLRVCLSSVRTALTIARGATPNAFHLARRKEVPAVRRWFFNYYSFYLSILHPTCSLPLILPSYSLAYPLPIPHSLSHPLLFCFIQERARLPWVSLKHDISNAVGLSTLPRIKAGQSDPEWGVG